MSVCCLPLRPMAGPTLRSFPGLSARFAGCAAVRCVREVYCRTAGETPLRSLRATPDPKSSAGRTGDRNAASGAWGLFGCGDSSSGSDRSRRSIRRGRAGRCRTIEKEMQRFVSITLGATMAPVGQLSRQFRQRPQRAPANGASYWSDGRVSTNSPSRT